jgi:hypothetical protein
MIKKKLYIKPVISRVLLDYSFSLQMATQPVNPPPRGGANKGNSNDTPFQSPFGDKPFS